MIRIEGILTYHIQRHLVLVANIWFSRNLPGLGIKLAILPLRDLDHQPHHLVIDRLLE